MTVKTNATSPVADGDGMVENLGRCPRLQAIKWNRSKLAREGIWPPKSEVMAVVLRLETNVCVEVAQIVPALYESTTCAADMLGVGV
jgi:hypothetical protein